LPTADTINDNLDNINQNYLVEAYKYNQLSEYNRARMVDWFI